MDDGNAPDRAGVPRSVSLVRGVLINVFGFLVQAAALLVVVRLLVSRMGAEGYGVLNLVLVVLSYLGLADFGLGRAAVRFLSDAIGGNRREEIRPIFWMTAVLAGLLGLVAAAVLAVAAPVLVTQVFAIPQRLAPEARSALRLAGIAGVPLLLAQVFGLFLEGHGRFGWVNALRVPSNILNWLLPLAGVLAGFTLGGIVVLLLAKYLLQAGVLFAVCWRIAPEIRPGFEWRPSLWRPLTGFGIWTGVLNAWSLYSQTVDRLLIGSLKSMTSLTLYAIPQQLMNAMMGIQYAFMPVLYPAFGRQKAVDPAGVSPLYRQAVPGLVIVMGTLCFGAAASSRAILHVWMGPDYEGVASVMRILSLGVFITSIASLLSTVVQATGHIRSAVASAVAASILQLTLTAALIGPMGLEGASFSFVLSSLLNAAGLAWGATRAGLLRWSDLLPARTALATAALAVLTLAAIAMDAKMRPDPWLTLAVMGVLSGLCGIAAWFLALDGPARRKLSQALGLRPPRPAQG